MNVTLTKVGLYCPEGDFYVDPWRPVSRAVVTHAHSDHTSWGCGAYLCHPLTAPILKLRLGKNLSIESVPYGESRRLGEVEVTFFPAGHIPGSAQVRIVSKEGTTVVTGDFKTEDDGLSTPFTPVVCDTLISESTFGLPIFRWQPQSEIAEEMIRWWSQNASQGKVSVVLAYSLGKAQRLAHLLGGHGRIFAHRSVHAVHTELQESGLTLPDIHCISRETTERDVSGSLVIAPPSTVGTPWMKALGEVSVANASGWMLVRALRRQRGAHTGFVISDHADYLQLLSAVRESQASQVFFTHGFASTMAEVVRTTYGIEASELSLPGSAKKVEYQEEDEAPAPSDSGEIGNV